MSDDDEPDFHRSFREESRSIRCQECSGKVSRNEEGLFVCDYCGVVANFVEASLSAYCSASLASAYFSSKQEIDEVPMVIFA
jgi:ribosomal protein L37AE/L43A